MTLEKRIRLKIAEQKLYNEKITKEVEDYIIDSAINTVLYELSKYEERFKDKEENRLTKEELESLAIDINDSNSYPI